MRTDESGTRQPILDAFPPKNRLSKRGRAALIATHFCSFHTYIKTFVRSQFFASSATFTLGMSFIISHKQINFMYLLSRRPIHYYRCDQLTNLKYDAFQPLRRNLTILV